MTEESTAVRTRIVGDLREEMIDLSAICDLFRRRIENDKDLVIAICGSEGSGKSTLALQIAREYDPDFSLDRNVIYNPNAQLVQEMITELPKNSVIVIDEAIGVMLKDEHFSKMQIFLKKVFATCRKQNKLVILCMPYFNDFAVYWRKHRIGLWFQVIDRGTAAVFTRDNVNIWTTDPWHMKESEDVIAKLSNTKITQLSIPDRIRIYRKVATFWAIVHYSNLPDGMKKRYLEYASQVTHELEEVGESSHTALWKQRFTRALRKLLENNVKLESLAEPFEVSVQTMESLLKSEYGLRAREIIAGNKEVYRLRKNLGDSRNMVQKALFEDLAAFANQEKRIVETEKLKVSE